MPAMIDRPVDPADLPDEVPRTAVREVIAYSDAAGNPADRDVATKLVATYYDAAGSPVHTVYGELAPTEESDE